MSDVSARERLLLLTGHLAEARVVAVMAGMGDKAFDYQVVNLNVKVAALMTEDIIRRRLKVPEGTTEIILPGRCRADLAALEREFGVPFRRGPDELADLPRFFGKGGRNADLSRHDLMIFSEIVDAVDLSIEDVLAKAADYRRKGADVIDIGCMPDTAFPHLPELVRALKAAGHKVSVDSASADELRLGSEAGADYILSLTEDTIEVARQISAVPVLVPARPGDLDSLCKAASQMESWGLPFIADPILDPIHFGFAESLARYVEFRHRFPQAEMMMGTGNLTELTEADTTGMTALLLGACSELSIRHVLTVQVSPHTRATIEEHDAARRIMYAAKADSGLPKGYGGAIAGLHDRSPYANTPEGIALAQQAVRDLNFRIEVAVDGIHVYNRDMHIVSTDAFSLFPQLGVEADGGHAFYLGAELQKAELAFRLGKRYAQDAPLDFGVATPRGVVDLTRLQEAGHTLRGKQRKDEAL